MIMTIPFRLRGHDGNVTVDYTVNDNPQRWGYDRLGLSFAPEQARGFPVCQATVDFGAEGYLALLGWIQLVYIQAAGSQERTVIVDLAPQCHAVQAAMPYMSWGACPRFFDAPANTEPNLDWRADAFLVATPDLLMTPVVQPVCGFHWGYATPQFPPIISALTRVDPGAWEQARDLLHERYPAWDFRAEWANERPDVPIT